MAYKLLPLLALSLLSTLVGCAATTPTEDADGTANDAAEELKSSECPPNIEVSVGAPEIPSNDALERVYVKDFPKDGDPSPEKSAKDQLDTVTPFLATARADDAVSVTGKVMQACAYKTVDANTGKPSEHRVWLARSGGPNGDLSLRMEQSIGGHLGTYVLFFSVPLKSVPPTSLVVDSSRNGTVYAEDTSNGHDGSDGFSIWIGKVNVTAHVSH
jgi:hypothetical protein